MLKLLSAALSASLLSVGAQAADPANTVWMEVSSGGRVVIELLPDIAPAHVERMKALARSGFYDGIKFHRVIEGFMAQTGDPTGTGMGGSDEPPAKPDTIVSLKVAADAAKKP